MWYYDLFEIRQLHIFLFAFCLVQIFTFPNPKQFVMTSQVNFIFYKEWTSYFAKSQVKSSLL